MFHLARVDLVFSGRMCYVPTPDPLDGGVCNIKNCFLYLFILQEIYTWKKETDLFHVLTFSYKYGYNSAHDVLVRDVC